MNSGFSPAVEAIGWSLLHFLWQGTVIALVLGLALQILRNRSPHFRYLIIGLTFIAMLGAFGATLIVQGKKTAAAETRLVRTFNERSENAEPGEASMLIRNGGVLAPDHGLSSSGAADAPDVIVYPLSTRSDAEENESPRSFFSPERIRVMLPWIVTLWVVGVVIFSLRTLSGLLHVRVCLGTGKEPDDPAWKDRFAALCRTIKVSGAVRLLSSSVVPVPIVVGWLKPTVLVPAGLFAQLPVYQLEAILSHELAHIRRHDFLVNLLQNVTETVFFFHPAIWWVSSQLRNEREHCCDDVAADQCGGAIEFAKALTALEEVCGKAPAMAVAATGGSLLGRVRRLLGVAPPQSGPVYSWSAGMVIFLLVAGVATGAHFVMGARDANAPVVHGYSLAGVPSISNTVDIPELYARPHFVMPVEADGGVPEVIFPVGTEKPHFYFRYHDLTYGPVEGDPMKRMNLKEVLLVQLNSLDRENATTRLGEILELGDDPLLEAVCGIISRVKAYDHQSIAAILREEALARPTSTVMARMGMIAVHEVNDAFYDAVHDEALERWEGMREKISESEYDSGKLINLADPAIHWGKPNEAGLRLGISGLDSNAPVPVGKNLDLKLIIHNDGDKDVKFTPSGLEGVGFNAVLAGEAGCRILQSAGLKRSIEKRIRLAPNQVYECRLAPIQTILFNELGVPTTRKIHPTAWSMQPGLYGVEIEFQVGIFDVRSDWDEPDPDTVPGLDEWTGSLAANPLQVQFAPPEIRVARPGDTVEFSDRHRLEFEKESVKLYQRITRDPETAAGEPVFDTWKLRDYPESDYVLNDLWKSKEPEGDYLAAWDVGGTRVWIRQGDKGVQCLEFHQTFRDGGRWEMRQAMGHLSYMPDGVRTALNLPGRFYMRLY